MAELANRNLPPEEWDVAGPRTVRVAGLGEGEPVLVFDFVSRPEYDPAGDRRTLSVAVEPGTGRTDMLR